MPSFIKAFVFSENFVRKSKSHLKCVFNYHWTHYSPPRLGCVMPGTFRPVRSTTPCTCADALISSILSCLRESIESALKEPLTCDCLLE